MKQAVARSLWASADCAEWRAALATYETAVRGRGVSRLEELDAWVRGELPSAIASRTPEARDEGRARPGAACKDTWTAHGVGQALWAAANPA